MQTRTATATSLDAADLDPGFRDALPPVVVGDAPAAAVERSEQAQWDEHWPVGVFVFLGYVVAAGLGLGAALSAVAAAFEWGKPPLEMLEQAAVMGVGAVFQWRLAKEVGDWSRWGWYGAMTELAAAAAAKVWLIAEGNVAGGMVILVLELLWMQHFWECRGEFDVDVDL
jgi:hypothetical protein